MLKSYLIVFLTLFSVVTNAQNFDHSKWSTLLQTHVSNNGNVDYNGFKNNEERLDDYLEYLTTNQPNANSSKNEKLAYWINAYNAYTVKLIIDNFPIKSIKDIDKPWDKKFIPIGGELLSLNHIEHEILRKMDEPRIHFAIVCASYSCPKLLNRAFKAEQLENQLTQATKEFLASDKNTIASNKIEISKIFKWFPEDFKQNGTLIDFLNTYSETQISKKAKKSFKDYDWSLNE